MGLMARIQAQQNSIDGIPERVESRLIGRANACRRCGGTASDVLCPSCFTYVKGRLQDLLLRANIL